MATIRSSAVMRTTLGRIAKPVPLASRVIRRYKSSKDDDGEKQFTTRRIKLKPRYGIVRRIGIRIIALYIGYTICKTLFDRTVAPYLDELAKIVEEDEEDEDGDEKWSLFFPFLGTTQEVKGAPYKENDPEWVEFVRLNKNKEEVKQVKQKLVDLCVQVIVGSKFGPMCDIKQGSAQYNSWLDMVYPNVPPPTFVRKGIEITDDEIAYATRPVDSAHVVFLRRVLWQVPSAMGWTAVTTAYEAGTKVVKDVATKISSAMTAKDASVSEGGFLNANAKAVEALKNFGAGINPAKSAASSDDDASSSAESESVDPKRPPDEKPTNSVSPSDDSLDDDDDDDKSIHARLRRILPKPQDMIYRKELSQQVKQLTQITQKTQMQVASKSRPYPPKGCVLVTGLVKVWGSKGIVTVDVQGYYSPKEKEFDVPSTIMGVRLVQPFKQTAGR